MSVWAVMMVRDEEDVAAGVVRHLCGEVGPDGGVIVADNGSTDRTRPILDELARTLPLIVVDDPEVGYYQAEKMTALANMAAGEGATWIVPCDADELWGADGRRVSEVLLALPATVSVARAPITNHLRTYLDRYYDDPFLAMIWRQAEPQELCKVAFRWEPGALIHQGNHGVDLPSGGDVESPLWIRHFPVRSAGQFRRKRRNGAQAYAAAPDLPEDWGVHWRQWGTMDDGEITTAYYTSWLYKDPIKAGLVCDPAPYRRWETPPPYGATYSPPPTRPEPTP